jgi:hypothetical protein
VYDGGGGGLDDLFADEQEVHEVTMHETLGGPACPSVEALGGEHVASDKVLGKALSAQTDQDVKLQNV